MTLQLVATVEDIKEALSIFFKRLHLTPNACSCTALIFTSSSIVSASHSASSPHCRALVLNDPKDASSRVALGRLSAPGTSTVKTVSLPAYFHAAFMVCTYEEPHACTKAGSKEAVEWSRWVDVNWVAAVGAACWAVSACHVCFACRPLSAILAPKMCSLYSLTAVR